MTSTRPKGVDYNLAAAMYADGKSLPKVAKHFGVHSATIYRGLKKRNVRLRSISEATKGVPRPRVPNPSRRKFDHADAKRRYLAGDSINMLAEIYGVNGESVRNALKRMGVARRPRGAGVGIANHQYRGVLGESNGYVRIGGKDLHRVIGENTLGRPLKRNEIVHHVTGDRGENRRTNLLICTQAYHRLIHARIKAKYGTENFPFDIGT
jgi:transposase